MGMFDTVRIDAREGQVKLWWCLDDSLSTGSFVGAYHGHRDYAVEMNEGGYVVVLDGQISAWQDAPPAGYPIFDKHGFTVRGGAV